MRIAGEWQAGDDGVTRPVVRANVQAADGTHSEDVFLVDPGADRTVFSAALLGGLGFAMTKAPAGMILQGISGACEFVVVRTVVQLPCDDGSVANMRGEFAAFTDPAATDLSILGRDILDHFDVILSRRRNEVLLLARNHHYRVELI
jgi:hypothetical protein